MRSIGLILSILCMFTSFSAQAIVSMQTLHLDEPVPGWQAGLDFGLSGAAGNTEKFRVSGGALLLNHHKKVTHYLNLKTLYGESSGVEDENKSFLHIRRIQHLSDRWAWELFGQTENNQFARLNLRVLAGTGGRYQVLETKKHKLLLGVGAYYSVEDIEDRATDTEGGKHQKVKGNLYVIYKRELPNGASFVSTTYAQPVLNKINDFRVLENASLKFKLTENTNFKFSLEMAYDSEPPSSVKKMDLTYSTGIELSF